jgi:hypothetical protein
LALFEYFAGKFSHLTNKSDRFTAAIVIVNKSGRWSISQYRALYTIFAAAPVVWFSGFEFKVHGHVDCRLRGTPREYSLVKLVRARCPKTNITKHISVWAFVLKTCNTNNQV